MAFLSKIHINFRQICQKYKKSLLAVAHDKFPAVANAGLFVDDGDVVFYGAL